MGGRALCSESRDGYDSSGGVSGPAQYSVFQYSWTSSIIYFGAILAVIPSLAIMQRVPAGKWLSGNVMIWGILLLASAGVKNFAGLMVVRFILGVFKFLSVRGEESEGKTEHEGCCRLGETGVLDLNAEFRSHPFASVSRGEAFLRNSRSS
ncbi:hypothetical protein BCR35DRAFT_334967 [Leucosporidium creatinivorum]|uniref:Major facilitator superfamily (MFS) profile domain-containing protein n=1 Tax=Leucosporidium creatinivorum TaxID=106004 RepID=A0A1Y2DP77_9BASI|nr:hypothetical protein BCR35DRAFT_334967 [Leucosporidium creatinivorum]